MAEEFIEEIYAEAKLLFLLKQIREYADLGYTHSIILKLNEILPKLGEVSKKYANTEGNTGNVRPVGKGDFGEKPGLPMRGIVIILRWTVRV